MAKKVWSQANPGIGRYGLPKFQNMVNFQSKTVKSFNEKMQKKIFSVFFSFFFVKYANK